MFNAPNKNNCASVRYKGYVDAKIRAKSNNYREYHSNAHYLFSSNKMRRELAALYPNGYVIISVDDMAKVKVGLPAVSRYHQVKRFLMSNDSPNLPDHDFSVPGYLLNVSGNMFLESKENSDQNHPGLVNSSVYNSHNSENHDIGYDMLMVNGSSENIFHTLACQPEIHLNVKMPSMKCKDQIIAYMKEQEEEKTPNTLNESLDLETIEAVLRAASA